MITQDEIVDSLIALRSNSITISCDNLAESILRYVLLIEKWNRTYNLTAAKTPHEIFQQHIMDSLSVLPHIPGPYVIDVGSGAGFPGMLLALARPDWQISLIEANQKKATFLRQVKIELMLANLEIIAARVEHFHPKQETNSIISRAFANLWDFISISQHLSGANGLHCKWLAMKAHCTEEELSRVQKPYIIEHNILLQVPGLDATRRLIIVRKLSEKYDSQLNQNLIH
ncbi:16S rRNA m(7)G-527 methyltransferase [Nitrosomonas sp. PY1]|uniref:16S rRNA (guanine(527)-N(7))-methyltransferase RsmG n=1 Tax=Nitrosomonas sp. PY1 TaxID=1803906 RepID=UPI001FC7C45A|nr:16S rRNA (guanine(527)-N(7))-methyltransferase RsmG [Nitrosomonas sp. PY1]GKS70400.1 16S rRNA m(7)G-527 methyltransferase [Nitrosomonas sp. PY1]